MISSTIGDLVQKKFQVISPYTGVNHIREKLILHSALVVKDEESGEFEGVLTPLDIVQRPHLLVIDCLHKRKPVDYSCKLSEALEHMQEMGTEVLAVFREGELEGLLFKNDLLAFMSLLNIRQGKKITDHKQRIEESEKILNALYDSTNSVRFFVAPDYTILFFNKRAYQHSLLLYRRKLKIGDNLMTYVVDVHKGIDKSLTQDFRKALEGESITRENKIVYTRRELWVKTEYHPVYLQKKLAGISINISDITDRKKNEEFIRQQNKTLKEIISFQSHEVRRPVASIMGLLQLIDRSQQSEENREVLLMLEKMTGELDGVIKTLVEKAYNWESFLT